MPRSRYSKISRRPGVHFASLARSCTNCQSFFSTIVSSLARCVGLMLPPCPSAGYAMLSACRRTLRSTNRPEDTASRARAGPLAGQGGDMTKLTDLHKKWMKDPEYRREYDALEEEFALASAIIEARSRAGLTQEELAARMETSQSAIARLESGRMIPSGRTLKRLAKATGTRLRISF